MVKAYPVLFVGGGSGQDHGWGIIHGAVMPSSFWTVHLCDVAVTSYIALAHFSTIYQDMEAIGMV